MDNPINVQKDEPAMIRRPQLKIRRPQRWAQKDEKGPERADFGVYRTQKAGMPRRLAFWTRKAGFSYMQPRAVAVSIANSFIFQVRSMNVVSRVINAAVDHV